MTLKGWKGFIMKNTTTLLEAVMTNGKLVAAAATQVVGYTTGAFVSVADSAQNHADANPEGLVHNGLTKGIKDQFFEAKDNGYAMMESTKDAFDITNYKSRTSKKTETPNTDNTAK